MNIVILFYLTGGCYTELPKDVYKKEGNLIDKENLLK